MYINSTVHKLHQRYIRLKKKEKKKRIFYFEGVPLVEFIYLEFTIIPGESYRRRLRSFLLYLCYIFRVLINSLECWFCTSALGLVLFQIHFVEEIVRSLQSFLFLVNISSSPPHLFVVVVVVDTYILFLNFYI